MVNFRTLSNAGKSTDSPSTSSKDSRSKPLLPQKYQFEPPESIAEESPNSIQRSATLNVRTLRRTQSNHTISSRQRLIDPEQFSSQNPWTAVAGSPPAVQPKKLRSSVSVASLATVRRFLKKADSQPLVFPITKADSGATDQPVHGYSRDPILDSNLPQSRDFSSSFTPTEIVLQPQKRNVQFSLVLKPESPLTIGGELLHGEVTINIVGLKDSVHSHQLGIAYLSVDLVGVECCNKRHYVFQSLAVDLIDRNRPPPTTSTPAINVSADGYWELVPSVFSIPFQLQIPEHPGPPSYKSRNGSIRYVLSTTAFVRTGAEETFVRDSCEVFVLGPHSPRISLVNLPQPLKATDTFVLSRGLPFQEITLKASLNRDVWVSGMSVFVDVHVRNRSLRSISKLTLSLERVMMVYHHPIAQLDRGLYRQSRLPDKIHRKTVASKSTSRSSVGWRGISPLSGESRTWMLNLPTGLATINTGRFFGVRYFLKVSLHLPFTSKTLQAQLPVTILDPNSLDMTPDFQPLRFTSSRARPSTINSDLPLPPTRATTKAPQLKRAEHRTPTQAQAQASRQQRETWAWVAEVSPHPSLVPSPLLPAYGIPSKTGKTPSRLRVENRASTPSVPDVPDRIRPPLEEQPSHIVNRGHQPQSSDYPMTSTDMTNSTASHDLRRGHRIGTSTIASLRAHVQGPDRRVAGIQPNDSINAGLSKFNGFEEDQAPTHSYNTDDNNTNIRDQYSSQQLKVGFRNNQQISNSPIRPHKAVLNRRAISRSKDVRAIYLPLSKENSHGQPVKHSNLSPENEWETEENFF